MRQKRRRKESKPHNLELCHLLSFSRTGLLFFPLALCRVRRDPGTYTCPRALGLVCVRVCACPCAPVMCTQEKCSQIFLYTECSRERDHSCENSEIGGMFFLSSLFFLPSLLPSFFPIFLVMLILLIYIHSSFLPGDISFLNQSFFLFFLFSWCYIVSVTIIAPFRRSFFFVLPSFFSSLFLLIFAFFYFILVVNFINITNLDLQSFIFFSLISFLTGDIFLPNH